MTTDPIDEYAMEESESTLRALTGVLGSLDSKSPNLFQMALEIAKAQAFAAVAVPRGKEIHALSKMNPRTPVYFSIWLAYEKRMNTLLGTLRATGKPLYRPMSFFTDVVSVYMRITPSTGKNPKNRAQEVLETLQKGGLLPAMEGKRVPFLPEAESVPDSKGRFF